MAGLPRAETYAFGEKKLPFSPERLGLAHITLANEGPNIGLIGLL